MKRFVPSLFVMALLPCLAAAQDQGWASKFFKDGLTHDFKNVAHGSLLTHKFTMTNIYDVPFMMADAKVSCGCVTPKRPTTVIPPRGTYEFEIEMDTRRIPAGIRKEVSIYVTMMSASQKPGEKIYSSMATLRVAATPQATISCNPDRVNFGIIAAGQTPTGSITVSHKTNRQWTLDVGKTDLPFDVTIHRAQPVRGFAAIYQVNVTLKKNAPAGEFKHELQLQTSDPATPVLPITVEGNIQAALSATPNSISFGNVKVDEAVSRVVIVRGNGKPFKITGVEGAGDGINVKHGADAKNAQVVTIEYKPKQSGALKKVLSIKTDLGADLAATVAIEGNAVP